MAHLVGQLSITEITGPNNGDDGDADTVRTNDQAIRTAVLAHDEDETIHFQSGTTAERPAAGVAGRKWWDTDTERLYLDNGTSWDELSYIKPTHTGNFDLTGTLDVVGDVTLEGDVVVTGPLGVSDGLTITSGGAAVVGDVDVVGAVDADSVKQGGVALPTGTGTSGSVARWTGTNTLGTGALTDDGTAHSNPTQPFARIYASAGAAGAVSWTAAPENVGAMWSAGTPTRVTIVKNGTYLVTGDVEMYHTLGSSQNANLILNKNGVAITGSSAGVTVADSTRTPVPFSTVLALVAGDYLTVTSSVGYQTGRLNVVKVA